MQVSNVESHASQRYQNNQNIVTGVATLSPSPYSHYHHLSTFLPLKYQHLAKLVYFMREIDCVHY